MPTAVAASIDIMHNFSVDNSHNNDDDNVTMLDSGFDADSVISVAPPVSIMRNVNLSGGGDNGNHRKSRKNNNLSFNQSSAMRFYRAFKENTPAQNRELYARLVRDKQLNHIAQSLDYIDYDDNHNFKVFCTVFAMLHCAFKQYVQSENAKLASSSTHRNGRKRRNSNDSSNSDVARNDNMSPCGKRAKSNKNAIVAKNSGGERDDNSSCSDNDEVNETVAAAAAATIVASSETLHAKNGGAGVDSTATQSRISNLLQYAPEELLGVKSKWAMFAIAVYCLRRHKINVLAKTMIRIKRDEFASCRELALRIHALSKNTSNANAKDFTTVFDESERSRIVFCIFEVSRIINDKNISTIALDLDYASYLSTVDKLKDCAIDTIAPFHAIFTRWANQCVAPACKKQKFTIMCERFKANSEETVSQIVHDLKAMPVAEEMTGGGGATTQRRKIDPCFDPDQKYHVFSKGGPNWSLDVYPAPITINDVKYNLLRYKGCVFDVLSIDGRSTDDSNWEERLATIKEPRITLEYVSGSEMEKRYNKKIVGASWMKDGLSHYKMFEFRRKN